MIAVRKSETSRLVARCQTAARSIVVDPDIRMTFTEFLSWWAPTEFAGTRATPSPDATIANWLLIEPAQCWPRGVKPAARQQAAT